MQNNITNTTNSNQPGESYTSFQLVEHGPSFSCQCLCYIRDVLKWDCDQTTYSCLSNIPSLEEIQDIFRFHIENDNEKSSIYFDTWMFLEEDFFPYIEIPALESVQEQIV